MGRNKKRDLDFTTKKGNSFSIWSKRRGFIENFKHGELEKWGIGVVGKCGKSTRHHRDSRRNRYGQT